jgi:(p)ppGpp synthase/HD superfamily hydrolase
VYGYPGAELADAESRGDIMLGGCLVSDNDAQAACRDCGRRWDRPRPDLTQRFEAALALANRLHREQTRKSTTIPYVSHLLGVASLVLDNGGDEDEAIAALLHDAVEDQGGPDTLELVRTEFGDAVAVVVAGCSDTDQVPKPPWRARKEHHLAALRTAPRSVLLVKAADKLHNLRAILADARVIGAAVFDRFNASREETLWYYHEAAAVLDASLLAGTSIVLAFHAALAELDDLLRRQASGDLPALPQ